MTIHIHQAGINHIDDITPLFQGYLNFYGKPSKVETVRSFLLSRLNEKSSAVFLALNKDEEKPVGFIQLYPTFSSLTLQRLWCLNDLFVNSDFRGQRIGRRLVEEAQAFAKRSGAQGLYLQTATDNREARNLYEDLGWTLEKNFVTYNFTFPQPVPGGHL